MNQDSFIVPQGDRIVCLLKDAALRARFAPSWSSRWCSRWSQAEPVPTTGRPQEDRSAKTRPHGTKCPRHAQWARPAGQVWRAFQGSGEEKVAGRPTAPLRAAKQCMSGKRRVAGRPTAPLRTAETLHEWEKRVAGRPTAPILARYRCFLPDLAGLAGLRRVGPGTGVSLPSEAWETPVWRKRRRIQAQGMGG
jgi:hypothetical protein